jgi:hypothetical protein
MRAVPFWAEFGVAASSETVTWKVRDSEDPPAGRHVPTPFENFVAVELKSARVPDHTAAPDGSGVKPLQLPKEPPVPWVTETFNELASAFVVAEPVPYSFTADGSDPVEATTMHAVCVSPGFSPEAVKSAVSESSSLSATEPADQVFGALLVVAEKAA